MKTKKKVSLVKPKRVRPTVAKIKQLEEELELWRTGKKFRATTSEQVVATPAVDSIFSEEVSLSPKPVDRSEYASLLIIIGGGSLVTLLLLFYLGVIRL